MIWKTVAFLLQWDIYLPIFHIFPLTSHNFSQLKAFYFAFISAEHLQEYSLTTITKVNFSLHNREFILLSCSEKGWFFLKKKFCLGHENGRKCQIVATFSFRNGCVH